MHQTMSTSQHLSLKCIHIPEIYHPSCHRVFYNWSHIKNTLWPYFIGRRIPSLSLFSCNKLFLHHVAIFFYYIGLRGYVYPCFIISPAQRSVGYIVFTFSLRPSVCPSTSMSTDSCYLNVPAFLKPFWPCAFKSDTNVIVYISFDINFGFC